MGAPALLGPSGSGKTTVLRAIAGLKELDACTRMPPRQREVGFIFQGYALFGHLTVRRNAWVSARACGACSRRR